MATTPDTRHSLVIKKRFGYRGGTREFSNRYHFEGALPTDNAAWIAMADLVVAAEKLIYAGDVTIVEAIGYDSGSATSTNPHGDAVFTKTYTTAGTGTFDSSGPAAPGDCAAFVRYSTPARSTKNHPVYLSNYYHGVYSEAGGGDNLLTAQLGAMETYQNHWINGFLADGSLRERCGPRGAVATGGMVSPVIRHRDFPA